MALKNRNRNLLDLVLEHKWYDMIAAGEKPEEYRAHSAYWDRRIGDKVATGNLWPRVRFRRGYTSTSMTFRLTGIADGVGNPRWGAPVDPCWIIRFAPLTANEGGE